MDVPLLPLAIVVAIILWIAGRQDREPRNKKLMLPDSIMFTEEEEFERSTNSGANWGPLLVLCAIVGGVMWWTTKAMGY